MELIFEIDGKVNLKVWSSKDEILHEQKDVQ